MKMSSNTASERLNRRTSVFVLRFCLCVFAVFCLTGPLLESPSAHGVRPSPKTNGAPIAANDNYTVHNAQTLTPPVMANDSDPDNDTISFHSIVQNPAHGLLTLDGVGGIAYNPISDGFTGNDTFIYRISDGHGNTADGTVTVNRQNAAPVAVNDAYEVHGFKLLLPHPMSNDFDPDGDTLLFDVILTQPQHGIVTQPADNFNMVYTVNGDYVGLDHFSYRIKDSHGRTAVGVVMLNVSNQAPVAVRDYYTNRLTFQQLYPGVMSNDFDPDTNDTIKFDLVFPNLGPYKGNLQWGSIPLNDLMHYTANQTGTDWFYYLIFDQLSLRSNVGVVTLFNLVGLGGENNGATKVNSSVGCPINVTNGNMYLQESDYYLPGEGFPTQVIRTYNSDSQIVGLFGRGWSTAYDQSITVIDNELLKYIQPDGRAIYFGRHHGTSEPFFPLSPNFYGQITPTGTGYTMSLANGSVLTFTTGGKLASLADRNGNTTTLAYNGNGHLTSVTDPYNRVLTFNPRTDGRILAISDTIGSVAAYAYGSNDKLDSVTYADSSSHTFAYDGNSRLLSVTDALGHVLESHTYDSQGRATTSAKHGGAETFTLSYVSATKTEVTDSLGHVTEYTFDTSRGRNLVTRVEGQCGCGGGGSQVETWTYDDRGNVLSNTDALNHTVNFTYDANGNMLTSQDVAGTVIYTYNQFGQVLTRKDQLNHTWTNTYDANGNQLTAKDPLNFTTSFSYDTRGQLLTITDARNKVTELTWDTSGRLTTVEDALNNDSTFAYDARARVTSATNALNQITSYEYDTAGRLKKVIFPDSKFVQFTYDLGGRRTKVKDPRGNEVDFAYDAVNRLTSVTDDLNRVTSYEYNTMSRLTSVTDPLSRVTDYQYDTFNRLKKIIYPAAAVGQTRLEQSFDYDADGKLTKKTDTAGRETSFEYDSGDRLKKVIDPALKATEFGYNARSERTSVKDALNQTYSFTYDAAGQVTQATRAGSSMSYQYDGVGNVSQRTDYNGAITNYTYDDLNRLTLISYPNSTSVTYGYDNLSRLSSATNQNGTVSFSYNNRGLVSSTTDVWGRTLGFDYDENGNRTTLSLAGSVYATYVYDAINRLTQITDSTPESVDFTYDAANRLTNRSYASNVNTQYSYDGIDRLTKILDRKGSSKLYERKFQYNTASQITWVEDGLGEHSYAYDSLDRLTAATHPDESNESYAYDAVGNRLGYTYDSFNRISSSHLGSYTINANGNTTAGAGQTYSYDYEDRLTSATVGTVTVNYKYDALGRLVQRSPSNGSAVNYVIDGDDVIEDRNTSGTSLMRYLNGPGIDNKLRQDNQQTGASYYFHGDQVGSTGLLTDTNGNIAEDISYKAFGSTAGSTLTRFEFTGRERDEVTGLMYYRSRWYDPNIGRFISEDPIGFAGGDVNLYSYVGQNPLNYRDPSGLQGTPKDWADYIDSVLPEGEFFSDFIIRDANDRFLRMGYFDPCGIYADEFFKNVGRASAVAATLAGGARGLGVGRRASSAASAADSAGSGVSGSGAAQGPFNSLAPNGGLRANENMGGHLLREHVGRTQTQLADRLANTKLPTVSTFSSQAEAEAAVAHAFNRNANKIADWISSGTTKRFRIDAPHFSGSVLQRGASAPVPGTGVRVILKRNVDGGYHILTGFPTIP